MNPYGVYKKSGWESWGLFLGTGITKVFMNYTDLKKLVRKLKLRSISDYQNIYD